MRARPRRETPQLDTATPDGPTHESPPPRATLRASGSSKRQETVLLNASVGVQRVIGRVRRPSSQESIASGTHSLSASGSAPRPATRWHRLITLLRSQRRRRTIALPIRGDPAPSAIRAALRHLGHERTVAVAVAGIVLGASFLSVAPGRPGGDTGGPSGDGPGARASGSAARSVTTTTGTAASSPRTPRTRPTSTADLRRPAAPAENVVEVPVRLEHVKDAAAVVARPSPTRRPSRDPSSTTARCSSRSRSTRPSPTAAP